MAQEILVIEDDTTLNRLIVGSLQQAGYGATGVHRWDSALSFLDTHEPNLIIMDGKLPDASGLEKLPDVARDYPVVMLTAYGSVKHAVDAMKLGASDYLLKPLSPEELLLVVKRTLEIVSLRNEQRFCKQQLKARASIGKPLVGSSQALSEVRKLISAVAVDDITVLISGESGSGKELVASEIHEQSPRNERNFVAVDCCTLQERLFESELFGHERGAFTGADRQKKGLIEGAEGGTLFLDEIGEISPSIQAKLLRVIETGSFRRLGGTKDLHGNVRIVAATNRNLEAMATAGEFRADLFYRLNGFNIHVPPLRDRREDIPALAEHFLSHHSFSRRIEKQLSPGAIRKLTAYDWPGNIRELKNVMERAIILSAHKSRIQPEHLAFGSKNPSSHTHFSLTFEQEPTFSMVEARYLEHQLKKYSGRRNKVAEVMGISERSVYRMIKRYGLETLK